MTNCNIDILCCVVAEKCYCVVARVCPSDEVWRAQTSPQLASAARQGVGAVSRLAPADLPTPVLTNKLLGSEGRNCVQLTEERRDPGIWDWGLGLGVNKCLFDTHVKVHQPFNTHTT